MSKSLPSLVDEPQAMRSLQLPCETFRLENGLTVIVHENRKAPVVAVNLSYLVGSKDEPPGQTGFAHLFEHLMFCGSPNLPGSYIVNLLSAGASDVNASTSKDRTNYHQTVPTSALDYALFAESDRMGHFLEGLTQEGFDQQRGVVDNEKREGEGQPYGRVHGRVLAAMYPPQHPYAHEVIGLSSDLARATLDDAKEWFATFYGPSNAVLCLAGDIDAPTARRKVAQFFGHIPPGRIPVRRSTHRSPPRLSEAWRETLQDHAPYAQLTMAWHLPCLADPDTTALQAAAMLLAGSRSASLQRALVHCEDPLALAATCNVDPGELGSLMLLTVTARDADFDADRCEVRILEVLGDLAESGPTAEDLRNLKLDVEADFIRNLSDAGSVAGLLADSQREYGRADGYRVWIEQFVELTPSSIAAAVARWLTRAHPVRLEVQPLPTFGADTVGHDRRAPPALGPVPVPRLPEVQRARLSNGLEIVFAQRRDRPIFEMRCIFDRGHTDDPDGREGLASLATAMMSTAAGERDEFAFTRHLQSLGANLHCASSFEHTVIELSCLSRSLDLALEALADVLYRPRFDVGSVERQIELHRQSIAMSLSDPASAVAYVLPGLLFPAGQPSARPWTGIGTDEALARITCEELRRWHAAVCLPSRATLVVVGDSDLDTLLPRLESHLAAHGPARACAARGSADASRAWTPGVHVLHRADPGQAYIVAAMLVPPTHPESDVLFDVVDQALGRGFSSRINLNLRESRHWTYGAHSSLIGLRGPRPYLLQAAVQLDRTGDAMREIADEIRDLADRRPITAEELSRIKRAESSRLASLTETSAGLCDALSYVARKGLPDDHWQTRATAVQALTLDAVHAAARSLSEGSSPLWLVIGDRAAIDVQLREAGWSEPKYL